jgi:hypothetical protein
MYTLIDCSTNLIYGPYETFNMAHSHAEEFSHWEILNEEGNLVDWSIKAINRCKPDLTKYQEHLAALAKFDPNATVQISSMLTFTPNGHMIAEKEDV